MATSFKNKAVEELRKAKKEQRELEAVAHAQHVAVEYAKTVANEKRIAEKMSKIGKGEVPVSEVETVFEKPVKEKVVVEEAVVEVVEKPKPKTKPVAKKKGKSAKTKK